MRQKYQIAEPITPASRESWEDFAAEEFINRMRNG
jgi:hypothetical protein